MSGLDDRRLDDRPRGCLLILTALLDLPSILRTIGIILIVVGVVLWILGAMGRAVGPRRYYW
jgi:hypothetical protein